MHKKKCKTLIENYRPVASLSHPSICFERLLFKKTLSPLFKKDIPFRARVHETQIDIIAIVNSLRLHIQQPRQRR